MKAVRLTVLGSGVGVARQAVVSLVLRGNILRCFMVLGRIAGRIAIIYKVLAITVGPENAVGMTGQTPRMVAIRLSEFKDFLDMSVWMTDQVDRPARQGNTSNRRGQRGARHAVDVRLARFEKVVEAVQQAAVSQ